MAALKADQKEKPPFKTGGFSYVVKKTSTNRRCRSPHSPSGCSLASGKTLRRKALGFAQTHQRISSFGNQTRDFIP